MYVYGQFSKVPSGGFQFLRDRGKHRNAKRYDFECKLFFLFVFQTPILAILSLKIDRRAIFGVVSTVDFRNFIVFFLAETLAH